MSRPIVLMGGRLIDGTGRPPVEHSAVLITGKVITAAGPAESVSIPSGAEIVDVSGKTVMPGLIDGHVHLLSYSGHKKMDIYMWNVVTFQEEQTLHAAANARKALHAGVTTVREMAGSRPEISVKHAVDDGVIEGARVIVAGMVGMTAGHSDMFVPPALKRRMWKTADGVDECRKLVREYVRDGVDFIKVCTSGGVLSIGDSVRHRNYSMEELGVVVDEAHALGKPVAAHAHTRASVQQALAAGVDTIEHGSDLDDSLIETMVKNGTWLCPALLITEYTQVMGKERGIPQANLDKARVAHERHIESIQAAHRAGVKIFAGTDSCNTMPFGQHAREVELLVTLAGLSPMEAIVAATKNCAAALGISHLTGTIESGKMADVIVVDGDPLAEPRVLQDKVIRVFKEGTSWSPERAPTT